MPPLNRDDVAGLPATEELLEIEDILMAILRVLGRIERKLRPDSAERPDWRMTG
jgi:hypothetical protein